MAVLCRIHGHAWVEDRVLQGEGAKGLYMATRWLCAGCAKVLETRARTAS